MIVENTFFPLGCPVEVKNHRFTNVKIFYPTGSVYEKCVFEGCEFFKINTFNNPESSAMGKKDLFDTCVFKNCLNKPDPQFASVIYSIEGFEV